MAHDERGIEPSGETRRERLAGALTFVGLVGVAALLLPLSALVVEAISQRAENWILALQLVLVSAFGAVTGALIVRVPGRRSRRWRAAAWAGFAVLATVVADAIWLFLLAG